MASFTGTWQVVSSPDFDEGYLRTEVDPYVMLKQSGERVEGKYQVGLQTGTLDGWLESEDQQIHPPQTPVQERKRPLIAGFCEGAHQLGRPKESHSEASPCSLHSQGCCNVRFASADGAGEDDVLSLGEIFAAGELHDLLPANALQSVPLELLQGLCVRKARSHYDNCSNAGLTQDVPFRILLG